MFLELGSVAFYCRVKVDKKDQTVRFSNYKVFFLLNKFYEFKTENLVKIYLENNLRTKRFSDNTAAFDVVVWKKDSNSNVTVMTHWDEADNRRKIFSFLSCNFQGIVEDVK